MALRKIGLRHFQNYLLFYGEHPESINQQLVI